MTLSPAFQDQAFNPVCMPRSQGQRLLEHHLVQKVCTASLLGYRVIILVTHADKTKSDFQQLLKVTEIERAFKHLSFDSI